MTVTKSSALVVFVFLIFSSAKLLPCAFATDDPGLRKVDSAFIQAVSASDKKALSSLLDTEFTWTDSAGKTYSREQVLQSPPSSPANSGAASTQQRLYGEVGLILATSGKTL